MNTTPPDPRATADARRPDHSGGGIESVTTTPGAGGAPPLPNDARELELPHERDQATGDLDAPPHEVMRQAKKDLDAGLVDTDMRATPGLDAERRERLVPDSQ